MSIAQFGPRAITDTKVLPATICCRASTMVNFNYCTLFDYPRTTSISCVKAQLNRLSIIVSFANVACHGIINYVYSYKATWNCIVVSRPPPTCFPVSRMPYTLYITTSDSTTLVLQTNFIAYCVTLKEKITKCSIYNKMGVFCGCCVNSLPSARIALETEVGWQTTMQFLVA